MIFKKTRISGRFLSNIPILKTLPIPYPARFINQMPYTGWIYLPNPGSRHSPTPFPQTFVHHYVRSNIGMEFSPASGHLSQPTKFLLIVILSVLKNMTSPCAFLLDLNVGWILLFFSKIGWISQISISRERLTVWNCFIDHFNRNIYY